MPPLLEKILRTPLLCIISLYYRKRESDIEYWSPLLVVSIPYSSNGDECHLIRRKEKKKREEKKRRGEVANHLSRRVRENIARKTRKSHVAAVRHLGS